MDTASREILVHKKHAFRDYTTHGKGTGNYLIDVRVKISIAGDWGHRDG
jgi:hypothetical protein